MTRGLFYTLLQSTWLTAAVYRCTCPHKAGRYNGSSDKQGDLLCANPPRCFLREDVFPGAQACTVRRWAAVCRQEACCLHLVHYLERVGGVACCLFFACPGADDADLAWQHAEDRSLHDEFVLESPRFNALNGADINLV